MPDRYVRDGYLRSAALNALPVETREFYVRLLLVVDDFGCFDGREGVCATQCFPIRPADVDHIAQLLVQLHMAALIVRYMNAGKPYLAITQWGNDLRGSRRFPAPPVDVDMEGRNVRGKFGGIVGWQNPPGCDPVSILVDYNGEPAITQPDEWRPAEHLRPATKKASGWTRDARNQNRQQRAPSGAATSSVVQAASSTPHDAGGVTHAGHTPLVVDVSIRQSPDAVGGDEIRRSTPPATASPPSPTINGKIKFEEGRFVGLTEAQRIAWQEMFNDLSIPDQIDRAAAWLAVNNAERQAIENQGDGFGSFIVRWLLREVRPVQSPRTGHASPTGG